MPRMNYFSQDSLPCVFLFSLGLKRHFAWVLVSRRKPGVTEVFFTYLLIYLIDMGQQPGLQLLPPSFPGSCFIKLPLLLDQLHMKFHAKGTNFSCRAPTLSSLEVMRTDTIAAHLCGFLPKVVGYSSHL